MVGKQCQYCGEDINPHQCLSDDELRNRMIDAINETLHDPPKPLPPDDLNMTFSYVDGMYTLGLSPLPDDTLYKVFCSSKLTPVEYTLTALVNKGRRVHTVEMQEDDTCMIVALRAGFPSIRFRCTNGALECLGNNSTWGPGCLSVRVANLDAMTRALSERYFDDGSEDK